MLAARVGTFKFVFGVKFFSVCEYMEKIGTQYSTDLSACNGLQLLVFETKVTFLCWFVGLFFFPSSLLLLSPRTMLKLNSVPPYVRCGVAGRIQGEPNGN